MFTTDPGLYPTPPYTQFLSDVSSKEGLKIIYPPGAEGNIFVRFSVSEVELVILLVSCPCIEGGKIIAVEKIPMVNERINAFGIPYDLNFIHYCDVAIHIKYLCNSPNNQILFLQNCTYHNKLFPNSFFAYSVHINKNPTCFIKTKVYVRDSISLGSK